MKIRNFILIIIITSFLNACSSMNSDFDCPMCAGVMCKSIDQINGMVNNGQIRGHLQVSSSPNLSPNAEFQPYSVSSGFYPGAPLRYGETVQRIWVAPFEDTERNYHQDSYMYAIIKDGHWIGSPIKINAES